MGMCKIGSNEGRDCDAMEECTLSTRWRPEMALKLVLEKGALGSGAQANSTSSMVPFPCIVGNG